MRTSGLLTLLFAFIAMAAACNKEQEPDTNNNNNNGNNNNPPTETKFSCKAEGSDWDSETSDVVAVYVVAAGTKTLTISGVAADGSSITLSLTLWSGATGTFNTSIMNFTNYVGLVYTDADENGFAAPTAGNAAATGTLTISYWDETMVSGSFSFTGGQDDSSETRSITEGSFSVMQVN
jgi:hypothetical protein